MQMEAEWAGDLFWTVRRRNEPLASVQDQTLPHPVCGIFTILTAVSTSYCNGNLQRNVDSVNVIGHVAAFCFQWKTLV